MHIQQIISCGLISINVLLTSTSPANSQSYQSNLKSSNRCAATIQATKNKIERGRKVKVVEISKDNVSSGYKTYPSNRPYSYLFVLRGAATESILVSDKFLTTITKNIIKNCPSANSVTFGPEASDYLFTYGLMQNNKIDIFKCIDNLERISTQKLPWGYRICV